MPLQSAIPRPSRFSRWLERMRGRDLGPRAGQDLDEAPDPGRPARKRANDDEQESWISGYSAFWQDLAATWLVAALIAGIVLAVQSSNDPHRNSAPATTAAQAPPPAKATHTPVRGEPGSRECTDLDYAYGRC